MPVHITTNKKSIDIESISLNLTCLSCKQRYNVRIKTPQQTKNCRCGKGSFHIGITPLQGAVSIQVLFQYSNGQTVEMQLDRTNDVEIS